MMKYRCDTCDRGATRYVEGLPDNWIRIQVGGEPSTHEACCLDCAKAILNGPVMDFASRVPVRPPAPLHHVVYHRKGEGKAHLRVSYSQLLDDRIEDLHWPALQYATPSAWRSLLCGAGGPDHDGYLVMDEDPHEEEVCRTCLMRFGDLLDEARQVMAR